MPKTLNNEYLRNMAGAPSGKRLLNNDYLKMIAEGGGGGGGSAPAGSYKAGGSITASGLTSSLLTAANEGKVYNLSDELTITSSNASLFTGVEAGQTYPAGTNVAVIDNNGSYRFDVMTGFVDLSDYAPLDSPELTGTPTAPTATLGTDTDQIATTAFVRQEIDDYTVPTMSPTVKGGAKLGTGLEVTDGTLSVNTTASGDGSQAGPILSLSAKGWAEQDTTTGKNLFNLAALVGACWKCTAVAHADGSVTMTATESAEIWIGNTLTVAGTSWDTATLGEPIPVTAGSTYTISCSGDAHVSRVFGTWLDANKQSISYENFLSGYGSNPTTEKTITVPSGAAYLGMRVGIALEYVTAGNTYLARVQIELGSTATSYEPYTGGAPSPRPDFPQEIRVCSGRNLLDESTLKTGLVDSNGNLTTTTTDYVRTEKIPCDPSSSYVAQTSYASNRQLLIYEWSSDGSYLGMSGYSKLDGGTVLAFETKATTAFVCVIFRHMSNPAVVSDFVGGCQLTLGPTPHPYVPYGYVGMEAKGKNLLPHSVESKTESGITGSMNADGTYSLKGTATGEVAIQFPVTVNYDGVVRFVVDIGRFANGGNFTIYYHENGDSTTKIVSTGQTLDLTQNTIISVALYVPRGKTYNYPSIHAMLVDANDTSDKWEPYYRTTTPIPLPSRGWVAGLPDGTADTLTLDGAGKVTWERATNEVVLDGSENWQYADIYSESRFGSGFVIKDIRQDGIRVLCDYFREGAIKNDGSILAYKTGWIDITYHALTTAESFMTWLSTHPVTVLYPLATPVTEEVGYIEMPEIPVGAEITIPELDDLGVKYCVDASARDLAMMWYGKIRYEHDLDVVSINGTIDEVEDGVVELAGQVVTHEDRLSSVEGRLDAMQSLVRGADGYYVNESVTAFLAANFDGKLYGYSEPKTTAVAVTKTGANAGLANPTLGTATTSGSSVYRHRGPFQWHAAKGHVDADGVPHVRVIRGVDTDEDWEACDENVWSLRPVLWYKIDSSGTAVLGQVSDTWHYGLEPNPQAYLPDGTLRPYMLAPRYALGFENGVGVSKSGLKGYGRDVSHNSLIEQLDYANSGYSGKTIYELWYDAFMSRMIYGTKDFQTVMQGCTQYDLQYKPTVAETGVKRVILSNANAANLVVGSTMMLGDQSTANTDRNNVNAYNVFDGLVIESITTYDANNKAVNFVTDTTFDTATTYLLSTAPWHSGSCDAMDWDGSPTDPQSAKEVAFFQGCEILHGASEVLAGVILKGQANARQVPYVTYDTRNDATSITSDFVKCGDGLLSNTGSSNAWKYPLYLADHGGLVYGEGTGGSTTTGLSDGQYVRPDSNATDSEWQSSGYLRDGRSGGPAYVGGSSGVSGARWVIWSRLSGAGRSRG